MRLATVPLVAVLCVVLASCGSDSSDKNGPSPSASATKTTKVDIADFKFKPRDIQVSKGAKVTFTNSDTAPHTATSKTDGVFDTGKLTKGQSKAVTLKKAGTFTYYCEFHAFMKGKVTVK